MKRKLFWIFLVVVIFLVGGAAQVFSQSVGNTVYLPIILRAASFTPTFTLTPTRTFTPSVTFSPTFTFTSTFTKTTTNTPSPTITGTITSTPVTSPPLWSRTAYINTDGGSVIYNLGCEKGTQDKNTAGKQDSIVVLDFGSPGIHTDGSMGTTLFGIGVLRTSEIAARAELYAQGYFICTGSDTASQLTLAVGTTNYGTWLTSGTNARDHGRAWGTMVNDVNAWLVAHGYASQVTAVGASDIELTWNSPTVSKAWVNGYDETNLYDMYDYGDMAGCPSRDRTSSSCWAPWTMADVWYVAYGAPPANPLPLIYANSGVNARQWSWLSLWAFNNKGARMDIAGAFTQCQACLQRSGDASCPYLDNKPAQGWQQLYDSLALDGVSQGLRWSTDIFWMGDSAQADPSLCNGTSAPQVSGSLAQRAAELEHTLTNSDLPEDVRISLLEKLQITRRVMEQHKLGEKAAKIPPTSFPDVGKPVFVPGIFNGDEGLFRPWQVQISNRWQGWDGDVKVQVLAGKQSVEPQAGVVFTWRSDKSEAWQSIPAPTGVNGLRIISRDGNFLRMLSEDGEFFVFDWKIGKFIQ